MPLKSTQRIVTHKTVEELAELIHALQKTLLYGLNSKHPETGVTNREYINRELADVEVLIYNLRVSLGLMHKKHALVLQRKREKIQQLYRFSPNRNILWIGDFE